MPTYYYRLPFWVALLVWPVYVLAFLLWLVAAAFYTAVWVLWHTLLFVGSAIVVGIERLGARRRA